MYPKKKNSSRNLLIEDNVIKKGRKVNCEIKLPNGMLLS